MLHAKFKSEEALVSGKRLARKPLAVERNFVAVCPDHGEIWVGVEGHHITSDETVGYEADQEWKMIAFAGRNIDRKF